MLKERQIKFKDSNHSYTDEEGSVYTSVTTLIGNYKPKFDGEYWAVYSAIRDSGHKVRPMLEERKIWVNDILCTLTDIRTSKTLTLAFTEKEIKDRWKKITEESLVRGNETHNYLEDEINMFSGGGKKDKIETIAQKKLNSEYKYEICDLDQLYSSPVRLKYPTVYDTLVKCIEKGYVIYAEKRVYHSLYLIAGTIDVLAVKNDSFVIIDWKTNKDEIKFESGYFKKEWGIVDGVKQKIKTNKWVSKDERMLYPLKDMPECTGSHYTLQLSLYAYLCECWGLKCAGLILFHIRRTAKKDYKPVYYNIPYAKEQVMRMLNDYVDKRLLSSENQSERDYLKAALYVNKLMAS